MEELKEFIFVYYLIFFIIYSTIIVTITKFSNLTKGLLISVYLVVWVFVGADLEPLSKKSSLFIPIDEVFVGADLEPLSKKSSLFIPIDEVFVGADLEPLQQRKYIKYIEKNLSGDQKEMYHYIIKKLPLEERKKFIKKLYFRLEGEKDEKIEDLVSNF